MLVRLLCLWLGSERTTVPLVDEEMAAGVDPANASVASLRASGSRSGSSPGNSILPSPELYPAPEFPCVDACLSEISGLRKPAENGPETEE